MTHVLLAGVLGAAVLALVLMHQSQQKLASRLAKIEAEFAADKIARLTQQLVPPAPPGEEEVPAEPARRKRHLALYIGGGVAAILSSLGERLRSSWRRSPALTATGTVAVVAVASTAALCLPSGESAPDTPNAPQPTTASQPPHAGVSESPGQSADQGSPNDDQAGSNDSRYETTEIGNSQSGAGEPPEQGVGDGDGTEALSPNADHPSKPTAPSSPEPSPSTPAPSPSDPGPSDPGPVTPGSLTVGKVTRADTEKRWCEDVTAELHNACGSPVNGGRVTFGTHITDAFGGDWKTIKQTRELSTPVPAGEAIDRAWTLCVDSWRVPAGWHPPPLTSLPRSTSPAL